MINDGAFLGLLVGISFRTRATMKREVALRSSMSDGEESRSVVVFKWRSPQYT